MTNRPNINAYWAVVTKEYPEAQFDFWYSSGELHFYPTLAAKESDLLYSCYKDADGNFTFNYDF